MLWMDMCLGILELQRQWGMVAYPNSFESKGLFIVFLLRESGYLFVRESEYGAPKKLPKPFKGGWQLLGKAPQLEPIFL